MDEYFDKICSLLSNITGSIISWNTIFANLIAISCSIFFRNSISRFYATLDGMNDTLKNILIILSIITVYSFFYQITSAFSSFLSKLKERWLSSREASLRSNILKQHLFALSKKEIAIVKFILLQDNHMAWLPEIQKDIIFLTHEGIITPFSNHRKEIDRASFYYSEPFASARLFCIPDHIQLFIAQIPDNLSRKWKKVKPDSSFSLLQ